MNKKDFSLVVCSCDSYSDTWNAFFKCWKKNWPEFSNPIYLISETKSVGQTDWIYDISYPLHKKNADRSWTWSRCVEEAIKEVETDYILFLLDDFWLYDKVDTVLFNRSFEILKTNDSIGFILLSHINKLNAFDSPCEYDELLECGKGKPFRITTQSGLWRKDYFLKLLRMHESAWAFEPRASWRSAHYSSKRIFCLNYNKYEDVFHYPSAGTLQAGKVIEDHMKFFDESYYKDCIHRGTIKRDAPREYSDQTSKIKAIISKFRSILPK